MLPVSEQLMSAGSMEEIVRVVAQTSSDGGTTLLLAGTLNGACVADIEAALESARRLRAPVTFDFSRVRLIDRPMLRYLIDTMARGVGAVNCPEHVARWIRRESGGEPQI
jgi:hypothetical protein